MLSLNSPAFTALLLVMSLLHSPFAVRCLHLTLPLWKMVMELAFYLVINKFPGYVVLAAFVAALALLVYTYRITRVIALCLQGVSPFDEARYAAIDEYAHRMYRPDVSGASLVARDVAASPPFHGASAPAMSSSEACSSPRQLEGASEMATSPFSSPSVNGLGPLDRANPSCRPIVVGSVLVTNPNLISAESDVVLAGLSFDELCQLEADEKAYASRNMEIASDCNSPSNVAALSDFPVDGSVASGDAIVNDGGADMFCGALFGGVPAATAGAGVCSSSAVASADLRSCIAVDALHLGVKRVRDVVGDFGDEGVSGKRIKTRFAATTACEFCRGSVLSTVSRAGVVVLGAGLSRPSGFKRSRLDDASENKVAKRIRATFVTGFVAGGSAGSAINPCVRGFVSAATTIASHNSQHANPFSSGLDVTPAAIMDQATTAASQKTTTMQPTTSIAVPSPLATPTTAIRRIAVPRASSRRSIATTTATTITNAIVSNATCNNNTSTTKNDSRAKPEVCPPDLESVALENNHNDELEGFDLSNEEFERIMNELDCESD